MTASTGKATKQELRQEIDQLRIVGAQMSNLCYNLHQSSAIDTRLRENMKELYVKWDAIKRSEP